MIIACALACASTPPAQTASEAAAPPEAPIAPDSAHAKLAALSDNRVQLWVVVHVRANKTLKEDGTTDEERLIAGALRDADAVVQGGGDAIILINSRCEMPLYERVIAAVRGRYPDHPLGISALSYGPSNFSEGFRLAKQFGAQIVWTEVAPGEEYEYEDDGGAWKRGEVTPREMALRVHRETLPGAIHVSGVHMKYTRPVNGTTFEQAIGRALGSIDGINVTGPETGVLAGVERIRAAKELVKGYPVGLASGVSLENIEPVIGLIDYAIVGTSLKEPDDPLRTSRERVWQLRWLMNTLGGGRPAVPGAGHGHHHH